MAKGKHSYAKQRRAEQAELDRRKKSGFREKLRAMPKRYFIDAMGAMALPFSHISIYIQLLYCTIIYLRMIGLASSMSQ